jgi:hypothetical protein
MIVHFGAGNSQFELMEKDFRQWLRIAGTPVESPRGAGGTYRKSDFTGTAHRRLQRVMWSD